MTRASTTFAVTDKDVDGRDKPGHDGGGRGRRRFFRIAVSLAFVLIVMTTAFAGWVASLGPLPLEASRKVSTTVVDRNGKLLRAYAMADGRWRLPVDARTAVDPGYLKLLLAYEDRRFWSHGGVDPLALGRAALQFGSRGHIVSGGSTITMQLARLLEPRRERSVYAKLRQMVRAVQLERQLSKDEILDLYLALAPFGGNLEGISAASIAYFGKEPKRLSLAEAALLVALPQSPERRRLDRYPQAAHAARDRVLARMVEDGVVSNDDAAQAKTVAVPRLRLAIKALGVGYLLWLAYKLSGSATLGKADGASLSVGFGQGVMLQFVNIKAWLLALTLVAGWIAGQPDALGRFAIVAPVMLIYAFTSNFAYAMVGALLREWLAKGSRLLWFNRAMGLVLVLTAWWMVSV